MVFICHSVVFAQHKSEVVEDAIDELYNDTNIRIILKNGAYIYQQAMLASQTPSNDDDEKVSLAFGRL